MPKPTDTPPIDLTPDLLANLRALACTATSGEWTASAGHWDGELSDGQDDCAEISGYGWAGFAKVVTRLVGVCEDAHSKEGQANADFIIAAQPRMVIALIDKITAQAEDLHKMRGRVSAAETARNKIQSDYREERSARLKAETKGRVADSLAKTVEALKDELVLWDMLVTESEAGSPRYSITPGAALNTVVTSTKRILGKGPTAPKASASETPQGDSEALDKARLSEAWVGQGSDVQAAFNRYRRLVREGWLPVPTDPDILTVRKLLGRTYRDKGMTEVADEFLLGRYDHLGTFTDALEMYRAGKSDAK